MPHCQTYYMILWVHPILIALLCVAGCPIPIALVRIAGYPTPNGLTLYSWVSYSECPTPYSRVF